MDTIASYILNFANSMRSIEKAKLKLEKMLDDLNEPEKERAKAAAALLALVDEQKRMRSSFEVFKLRFTPGINPPSAAIVSQAIQLSTDLADVIATANKAVAIINAVTQAVNGFVAIANAPSSAATVTAGAATPAPAPTAAPATVVAMNTMTWLMGGDDNAIA